MSTQRNHSHPKPSFNEITQCYEYRKEEEEPWIKRYIKEERVITREQKVNDLLHSIPKEVKWSVEKDIEEGALALANHFGRIVVVRYEDMSDYKLPKEALTNYRFKGPGGPFESINYQRGLPQEIIINPEEENKSDDDSIKIRLIIKPNKDHYLSSVEMNKKKVNDYCLPCMLNSTSTAATVGAGDKSARKTKGRQKREKAQLHHANGGADI